MPARLEKCKQTVPQLAHTVPWSELEKGAPTGQTQCHRLMIWQSGGHILAPFTLWGTLLFRVPAVQPYIASSTNTHLLISCLIIRLWKLHRMFSLTLW